MSRIRIITLLTVCLMQTAILSADDSGNGRVTFTKDVAPILQSNCQKCHRPDQAAPMSLLTYEEARPWAKSIRKAVVERSMPPWHADPAIGKWRNEMRLTDEEIGIISRWADQGAPEGDPADLPPPVEWTEGWLMGEPDLILPLTREQVLAPELVDEYRYLFIPTKLKEDTWIEAVEVRPGNREVVHHVNVFESASLNSPEAREAIQSNPGAGVDSEGNERKMGGQGTGPQGELPGRVGGFLPGGLPTVVGEGQGILLPKGCMLMLQIHYHKETGLEARDRTSVGLRFKKGAVEKRLHGGALDECRFVIPAGAANHEVRSELIIDADINITAMSPHMHLRGKDYRVWADLPDGTRVDILNVPRYDFNWQMTYEPEIPIALPKGARLRAIAHFDNSAGNPFNPDPTIDVEWGEPTTDEMMLMFFRYTYQNEEPGA